MIIPDSEKLIFQPFNPNYKRCGCYVRNVQLIPNIKPKTHVAMPLQHIDYDIEVTNGLASITLQQKYLNPTEKFLEIDFSFPIDPKACIYKFVAEFGNKRIQGIVKEKEEAKKQYKEAVSQGKQAVYAEIDPNSKDIMNMQIGNLGPKQEVRITISYLQELNVEQNTFYQLHIPSTISPRYMNDRLGVQLKQNIPSVKGDYTWTFKITLLTTRKLVYYVSPSHNLTLISQNSSQTETILCLAEHQKPNNDLFLLFAVENFHLPNYILGRTDISSTAMLSFIPKFCQLTLDDAMAASMIKKPFETDISAAKGQYVFLLDRSGSMGGSRMQKAKQALILFLQSLPQDTYFNVISFGSHSESLFKSSAKYNQQNLKTSIGKIKKMSADMGGTQIYAPLSNILINKIIEGYPKQIFILTDGGVSNTEGVIDLVRREVKYSRCHSIGIGNGCSQALIKGCAEKGKGKYIFIQDSENPSQKIIGLLEQTLTPVINNVSLNYDKNLVESIVPNPDSIPYILKNEVVNFYITFKGQLDKKTNFTFGYKDTLNKVPFQTVIEVDPESQSVPFVDKMAHCKIIKNLESAAKDNKPIEDYMYYVKVTDKKQEAIKHSVKHQILSQYTAFICVEKELVDGKFEQIKDKGTQKVKVEPIIPQDFGLRAEMLDNIMLCSANLQNQSIGFAKCAAKKKSAGSFLGNITSSIASGVTNFFSSKPQQPQKYRSMMQKSVAPQMAQMSAKRLQDQPQTKSRSSLMSNKQKLSQMKSRRQQRCKKMEEEREQCEDMEMNIEMGNQIMDECSYQPESMKCEYLQEQSRKMQKKKKEKMLSPSIQSKKQSQQPKTPLVKVTIESVIQFQNIDGSFDSEVLIKSLFPQKWSEIQQQIKNNNLSLAIAITFLVAKWIQKNHPQKQYSLIVKKAYSYIKKTVKLQDLQFLVKHIA